LTDRNGFVHGVGRVLDIHWVIVHRDCCAARRLLNAVLERDQGCERVIVQAGAANAAAQNVYASYGFRSVKVLEVVPGLWVTRFER
jgi:hypothetical protein